MKENGLFTSDQSSFLRLHSTLTSLLKVSDDWYNGPHLGKLMGLVFIDMNERKPSGDSQKAVYSVAAKSLDRAICIHFSYHRLDTVASSVP